MSTSSTAQPKIRQWASGDGEFRRQVSSFRDCVSRDPNARFAAEPYVYTIDTLLCGLS
jgi:putative glutathione S-transferase